MRDAIQGMLTMSRGGRSGSALFSALSQSHQQQAMKGFSASEEEIQLMADCYQDSEYGKHFVL